eukprot:TRINITY_DN4951_c0_g1_i1.p1 TRINITY_DN4951_c0_g1~~TRINITY_DN4951_c0_g1_i1.p1  ORF type:complete len:782 (+),score=121.73 TRINITY_DN4951_c0_g1_i1:136-2481(+)
MCEYAACTGGAQASKDKKRRHGQGFRAMTVNLIDTYNKCCEEFTYSPASNIKRTLTWPAEGVHNSGLDNADYNLICRVGDTVVNRERGLSYTIVENLGQGSFGQVLKCEASLGGPPVALKIAKNKPAYFKQGCSEANILQRLNCEYDADDKQNIVRMLDCFVFRKHICIAFEMLTMNVFEFLKWQGYRGMAMTAISTLMQQLLKALSCLRGAGLIHCDLKPENVMICSLDPIRIKLIDFGSACAEFYTLHSYVQSRFYRSPEVLLGLPYTSAIDMWSAGCIGAELFLGLPIFPGQSEHDQLTYISNVLGQFPLHMLDKGTKTRRFFRRTEIPEDVPREVLTSRGMQQDSPCAGVDLTSETQGSTTAAGSADEGGSSTTHGEGFAADEATATLAAQLQDHAARGKPLQPRGLAPRRKTRSAWRMKTSEEYARDEHTTPPTSQRRWNFTSLEQMAAKIPEEELKLSFVQFLHGLLKMSPKERWTATQALQHAFLNSEARYDPDFEPTPEEMCWPPGVLAAWAGGGGCDTLGTPPAACQPLSLAPSFASSTGTPASSPHGSVASTMVSGLNAGAGSHRCATQSSGGPSPWHLQSPGGDLSTASDYVGSSQPSGSESCEVRSSRLSSQSESSHRGRWSHLSDSDSASALGAQSSGLEDYAHRHSRGKDGKIMNMRGATRGELSSMPLHFGLDSALSPKSGMGNFREAVGMGESGPVVPIGPGGARPSAVPGGSEETLSMLGPESFAFGPAARGAPLTGRAKGPGQSYRPRGRRRRGVSSNSRCPS